MNAEHIVTAVRGSIVYLNGDPFLQDEATCLQYIEDGMLVISNGKITESGIASEIMQRIDTNVPVRHYADSIIMPGFVDTHIHYVQMDMMASYGKQLLDWLNTYTFVEEQKFQSYAHSKEVAVRFLNEMLKSGTTTALVFCAVYPQSVDALFEEAAAKNIRLIAGKVLMDRNAPNALLDTAKEGYEDSKALIKKWHGKDRLQYAITPRFAATSTNEQLEAAGQLWKEHPDTYMHSHISENRNEVQWIKELFPDRKNYLDVYDHFGLTGKKAVYAHGVHLTEDEFQCCHDTKTSLAHCPSSNLFLGSGLFNLQSAKNAQRPVEVGLGSDIGGGTSFSLLNNLSEAYKIAQLRNVSLNAIKLFYLATLGGARALSLDHCIGTLEAGKDADFVVLDKHANPLLKERMSRAASIEDVLFVLTMLGNEETVKATYVAGIPVYEKGNK